MPDTLLPARQKSVRFYGDVIFAVQLDDERIFVPIRQMCEALGITYQGQIDRIRRDNVLSKYELQLEVDRGQGGGYQVTNCLDLKMVPGWLFGISSRRVRQEIREKLERYQEQVYEVIWDAFRNEVESPERQTPPPVDELEAIAQMGLAIYRLARQQRAIDERLGTLESTVWEMGERTQGELSAVRQELGALELRLQKPASGKITEQQATELSQAVKLVAMTLGKRTGRNEFGAIYGELYRRFGITSYRNLPVHAFQEAMDWLSGWFQSLTEDSTTSGVVGEKMAE